MKNQHIGFGLLTVMAASLFALTPALAATQPKQVQIKAEIYTDVSPDWERKIMSDCKWNVQFAVSGNTHISTVSGDMLKSIKKTLTDSGAKLLASPIISTVNNVQAQISVATSIPTLPDKPGMPTSSLEIKTTMVAKPIVNADNTVTLSASVELPRVELKSTEADSTVTTETTTDFISINIMRRMAAGDSILATTAVLPSGKMAVVIFTPTIIN